MLLEHLLADAVLGSLSLRHRDRGEDLEGKLTVELGRYGLGTLPGLLYVWASPAFYASWDVISPKRPVCNADLESPTASVKLQAYDKIMVGQLFTNDPRPFDLSKQ